MAGRGAPAGRGISVTCGTLHYAVPDGADRLQMVLAGTVLMKCGENGAAAKAGMTEFVGQSVTHVNGQQVDGYKEPLTHSEMNFRFNDTIRPTPALPVPPMVNAGGFTDQQMREQAAYERVLVDRTIEEAAAAAEVAREEEDKANKKSIVAKQKSQDVKENS